MATKRLTALVNGIDDFVKKYGVYPHIAVMHPTSLSQLKREIEETPLKMKNIHRAIKRTELTQDPTMAKGSIVFTMKDKSL